MSDMLCHLTFSPVIFEVRKEGSRAYITLKVKNRRFAARLRTPMDYRMK